MNKVPKESIWKQINTLIPVYMTLFMIGCGSGWFSNVVYFLLEDKENEIHATTSQCVLIPTFNLLGKFLFAIPAGILTDTYGRRKMIISIAVLLVFCWSAISLTNQLNIIYASRFVGGIADTMISATSIITIGEISSPEIRGTLTSIGLIIMNVGIVSPSIIEVVFSSYKALSWGVAFFSIITLLSAFWAIESPSFLISVSKFDQARTILKTIRPGYPQYEIENELKKLEAYILAEKARKSEISWLKFMNLNSVRRPLVIGILVTVFTSLMGIALIKSYTTVIIPPNKFVPKKYYPLINQIISFLISISTTFYIDRFPRRSIHRCGASAMIIINLLCSFASYFMDQNQYWDLFRWIFTVGNILLLVCYGGLLQPMSNTLNSELYPQAVKGFCGSITLVSEALSSIIIFQLYGFISEHFHLYFMYLVFSTSAFFLFLVVCLMLPESRGVLLSDLQANFNKNPPLPNNNSHGENRK